MLGVQILTGVLLSMHYVPHVDLAFDSVERIMRDVSMG
jgi:quinol-cytochrome oxidoreductase complex cytochrome b subunit